MLILLPELIDCKMKTDSASGERLRNLLDMVDREDPMTLSNN